MKIATYAIGALHPLAEGTLLSTFHPAHLGVLFYSTSDWWTRARQDGVFVSALWNIPGVILASISSDFMHTGCLGVLQYLLGNICWELVEDMGASFSNSKGQLSNLLFMLRSVAKDTPVKRCPLADLTIQMIKSAADKSPKMKTKAAEGRYLLVIVCALLAIMPRVSFHDRTRFQCCETMCKIYELMEAWDEQSPPVFRVLVQRFLLLYAELRREASALGNYTAWRLYPKHHLFAHMDFQQSPRLEWNYPSKMK